MKKCVIKKMTYLTEDDVVLLEKIASKFGDMSHSNALRFCLRAYYKILEEKQ